MIQPGKGICRLVLAGTPDQSVAALLYLPVRQHPGRWAGIFPQYSPQSALANCPWCSSRTAFFRLAGGTTVYGTLNAVKKNCRLAEAARALDHIRQLPNTLLPELANRHSLGGWGTLARAFLGIGAIVVLDAPGLGQTHGKPRFRENCSDELGQHSPG